jgi:hypothetical protein
MVAMLLTHQPFYIGGIEDVAGATRNAYGAMATFLCTFILSVVYLVQDVLKGGGRRSGRYTQGIYSDSRRWNGDGYDGVPTNMMMVGGPDIMHEHEINLDLPMSVEQAHFT